MDAKEIMDRLKSAAARVYVSQRAVEDAAKREYEILIQSEERRRDIPLGVLSDVVSFHNMTFRRAETNEICSFALHFVNVEKAKRDIVVHKNKLYLWLLAEMYELFEDFLEEAYAWAGYCDNEFWPLSDYGSITLSQLKDKNYEWFLSQARQKKGAPKSIISRFRERFPKVAHVEINNRTGINYKLAVELIEQLRHLIVHNSGVTQDRKMFVKSVLEKCGLYNNAKPSPGHVRFVESFFGSGEKENLIVLLEAPANIGSSAMNAFFHVDVFEGAAGMLMSYADLIHSCLPPMKCR